MYSNNDSEKAENSNNIYICYSLNIYIYVTCILIFKASKCNIYL